MLKRGRVNLKNILLVFMVLQPFFDSYVLYSDEMINMVGFSPTTILRFLLIGLIFIYLFFNKVKKKENKYIFLYGLIVLLYTIIHHFVCINIDDSMLYKSFRYSLMGEVFYLLRLVYPIILMYIVYLMKLSKKEFKFVIQGGAIILSFILIFMNLSLTSQTSYFSKYIKGTIFDWFFSDISRYLLAGKGWFNSANQIGGLLILLIPINFYYAIKDKKFLDLFTFLILLLSSYSLGTRISCVGISLILIILIISFYIFKFIEKEVILKKEIGYTLIISIWALFIFNYAPVVNLSGNNILSLLHLNKVVNDNSNDEIVLLNPDYDGSDVCKFLEKTSTNIDYYKKLYPCQENLSFWTNYVKNDYYKYTNNRLMEKLITNLSYDKIKSIKVNLFGMSRSRYESAGIYLERDVVVHYYTIGILGIVLFILPYFVLCGYVGIEKLIRKKLTYWDMCLISAVILPLLVSILTGHIVDELIVTLYIGFCLGYLLFENVNNKNQCMEFTKCNNDERRKVLFVVDENRMGGVSILLEDIIKNIDRKKYIIDILVLHDVDEYLKNLPDDVKIIYGTNFFEAIDYNLINLIKEKKIKLLVKKLYLIFLMKSCLIKYKIKRERKKILNDNYDVEIAFKDGFTAIFTAFGTSKKKIHWLHYEYKKYNANGNYPMLFNKILPSFDKIVAVSENVMNDFNAIYHLEEKTSVIGNYIDVERIRNKATEKCDRVLNDSKVNIVCVGRLHECKGYDRLINVVAKLENKYKNKLHIEIYGDGGEKDKLSSMIAEYNLKDIIFLKGRVNNPYKYIKNNDLFILCSRFETFGLVIVEAMALGVPVFALENSNTSNLINNNVNGYIVSNDDESFYKGLLYLIKNKKIIAKYKKNLISYEYDNKKIIESIEVLLNEKNL